ncbi:ADP-ribose pyrophosphatase YjhB (NUDIX family) [Planomicrobium soli]|uniref:ADP-ribose pyrophosphatase YjhB (NUDIX family) n=1 Tax=Planomicrobium soli TaxID=1176648 RepID=A0A2P8H6B7_9BACL|nr:NUDIX hydrolase [Planomicrobium soli]PSL41777.1 ADP-ribose pyrophosphatase YjhB (NUDIX family) [Planomicrobium soli]
MSVKWLEWAQRIQSLAQAGLTYTNNVYDIERFEELRTISTEIMNEYTGHEMEKLRNLFAYETGYQTPKVDIRGAVFQNGKILLVREIIDDKWSLPGGFCDVGLSPAENIVKEIKEESGFDVVPTKLLALLDMKKHEHPPQPFHYYKVFIQCNIVAGKAEIGIETKDVQFFSENNLPELSLARNTEAQIQLLFEFSRDPQKETVFD